MLRRSFVTGIAGAAATALSRADAAPAPDMPVKLGFDTYSVRAFKWKASQLLDYAGSLKLDTIQISSMGDYESYEPADARYLRLHTGHLMWVRPEEEPFLSGDLIRLSTFTGTRDELVDRVRTLRDAGYDQLAVQLVPGHEDAMNDWMEVFSRV